MKPKDWADKQAEELFELVRACVDDQDVIDAIAEALREAANPTTRFVRKMGALGKKPRGGE